VIDRDLFLTQWAILEDRFRREHSRAVALEYLNYLNAIGFDDAEFRAACAIVFVEREYFPRPVDFEEATRGQVEARALDAWQEVLGLLSHSPNSEAALLALAGLDVPTSFSLDAVGGIGALRETERRELRFLRADFLKAWAVYDRERRREVQADSPHELTRAQGVRQIVAGSGGKEGR
jgi:hypothetical protein